MRSMQVERAGSLVAETSVGIVGIFVFAQKNCIINLSMLAMKSLSVREQSMASRSVST